TGNDIDVDGGTGGTLLASHGFSQMSVGQPGELAVDATSGRVYFQSNLVVGAVDTTLPSATAIVGSIPTPFGSASLHRVDPATRLIYFRAAIINGAQNVISVINPLTNQQVGTVSLPGISGFAIDSTHSRLYVLSNGRLEVVDAAPASATFLQTVNSFDLSGAGTLNAIAVNGTSNQVYIAASGGVGVFNASTGAFTQVLTAPAPSSEIAVDETHNRIFAAGTTAGNLTTTVVIDGATNTVVGVTLNALGVVNSGSTGKRFAVNASSGRAYLRTSDPALLNGWVVAIDPSTPTPTATNIPLAARDFGAVSIVSDDSLNKIVTNASIDLQLIVIDGGTNLVAARLHTNQGALGTLDLDATRHKAYLSVFGAIVTVDTSAQTVSSLPLWSEVGASVVNPVTHSAYVASTFGTSTVDVFDATGASTPVGNLPHDGRFVFMGRDTGTNKFYVANNLANAAGTNDGEPAYVAEIDGATNQVLQTLPAGSGPFGLAVNSTTHKVYVGNLAVSGVPGGITEIDPVAHTSTSINVTSLHSGTNGLSIGRSIVVNEVTNRLYFQVLNGSSSTGAVVNLAAGNGVTPLPVAGTWGTIREIEVDSTRNRVYVGTDPVTVGGPQPGRLHVLDGS
ncbi:MAG TPA: hypothetical protein VKI43_10110, partial [Vicinamibacterales bacterium]|nr:hypothetical protein [Vicinamibacterales bacterium]